MMADLTFEEHLIQGHFSAAGRHALKDSLLLYLVVSLIYLVSALRVP